MPIVEVRTKLHRYQDQAVFASERFVALISGIQGGKTTAGAVWSRLQYDANPDDIGMVCAPTYKILSQSTLPKFFERNPDLQKYYKKADSVIEQPGRGIIYVRSLENPNAIEGMTLSWIWADEAGQMKYDAWINMQGRVAIKQGKILLTTTPYNMGWLYSDFYQLWKGGDPNYRVVQFRSIDSEYFPTIEYQRAKKTMDARIFKRRYEGQFERMEGLVYDAFNLNAHVTDNIPKEFDHVIAGVDWGYEAPTAMIVIGIKQGVFYLIDEFYGAKKTQPELEEIALGLKDHYHIVRWYPDSAEPDRIESFNRRGLYSVEVNKEVGWGIAKVQDLMRTDRFKVHPRCRHFIAEIECYHYPEKVFGREIKEDPVKGDDHLQDAARYALASYQGVQKKERKPVVYGKVYPSAQPTFGTKW